MQSRQSLCYSYEAYIGLGYLTSNHWLSVLMHILIKSLLVTFNITLQKWVTWQFALSKWIQKRGQIIFASNFFFYFHSCCSAGFAHGRQFCDNKFSPVSDLDKTNKPYLFHRNPKYITNKNRQVYVTDKKWFSCGAEKKTQLQYCTRASQ